jgi:hypothetical protein
MCWSDHDPPGGVTRPFVAVCRRLQAITSNQRPTPFTPSRAGSHLAPGSNERLAAADAVGNEPPKWPVDETEDRRDSSMYRALRMPSRRRFRTIVVARRYGRELWSGLLNAAIEKLPAAKLLASESQAVCSAINHATSNFLPVAGVQPRQ